MRKNNLLLIITSFLIVIYFSVLSIFMIDTFFNEDSIIDNSLTIEPSIDINESISIEEPTIDPTVEPTIVPSVTEPTVEPSEPEPTIDFSNDIKPKLSFIRVDEKQNSIFKHYYLIDSYIELNTMSNFLDTDCSSLSIYDETYFIDNALLFIYCFDSSFLLSGYSLKDKVLNITLRSRQNLSNDSVYYVFSASKNLLYNYDILKIKTNDFQYEILPKLTLYEKIVKEMGKEEVYIIDSFTYNNDKYYAYYYKELDNNLIIDYLDCQVVYDNASKLYAFNLNSSTVFDFDDFSLNDVYLDDVKKNFIYEYMLDESIRKYAFENSLEKVSDYKLYNYYENENHLSLVLYFPSEDKDNCFEENVCNYSFNYYGNNKILVFNNDNIFDLNYAFKNNLIKDTEIKKLHLMHNQTTYFKLSDVYPFLNEISIDDIEVIAQVVEYPEKASFIKPIEYFKDINDIEVLFDRFLNMKLTVSKSSSYIDVLQWKVFTKTDNHIISNLNFEYEGLNLFGYLPIYESDNSVNAYNIFNRNETVNYFTNNSFINLDTNVLTNIIFEPISVNYVYRVEDNYFETPKKLYLIDESIFKYEGVYYKIIYGNSKIKEIYNQVETCDVIIKNDEGILFNIIYKKGDSKTIQDIINDFIIPFNNNNVLLYENNFVANLEDMIVLSEDVVLYLRELS